MFCYMWDEALQSSTQVLLEKAREAIPNIAGIVAVGSINVDDYVCPEDLDFSSFS